MKAAKKALAKAKLAAKEVTVKRVKRKHKEHIKEVAKKKEDKIYQLNGLAHSMVTAVAQHEDDDVPSRDFEDSEMRRARVEASDFQSDLDMVTTYHHADVLDHIKEVKRKGREKIHQQKRKRLKAQQAMRERTPAQIDAAISEEEAADDKDLSAHYKKSVNKMLNRMQQNMQNFNTARAPRQSKLRGEKAMKKSLNDANEATAKRANRMALEHQRQEVQPE